MIYAVNKRTKEHRAIPFPGDHVDEWYPVLATPDGWIEWQGGECPLPDGAKCEYRMRDGDEDTAMVFALRWTRWGDDSDIIAYRPILDADTKPEAPAWDGEGLPPVGCEVEISRDSQLYEGFMEGDKVEVLAHKRAKAAEVAVVWSDTAGKSAQFIAEMFRPVRSEEEIAAEIEMNEASKMLRDAHLQGMRRDNEYDTCRALYRAGYRKHDN